MRVFHVSGPYAEISAGKLALSPDQFRSRQFALRPLGADLYEILKPIGFKHGEIFGFDGDLPRCLALNVSMHMSPAALKDLPLETLRDIANELGLTFHRNSGKARLIEIIESWRNGVIQ